MSSTQVRSETAIETPRGRRVDMKLEVVVIPVSDVNRAKSFYSDLGWRLDADFAAGDDGGPVRKVDDHGEVSRSE